MEDDSKSDVACKDIARQLIENEPGRSLNVIMGGGLRSFVGEASGGRRKDGRNLTLEWSKIHPRGEFVTDRSQLMAIKPNTEHVLGIFNASHMHFNADRDEKLEPSLAEMTAKALEILTRRNANGFLLVVEAGKIDLAHHYNNAFRALDDTLALDEAVKVALNSVGKKFPFLLSIFIFRSFLLLDLSDSLVIVTADHASAMVYSGYATPKDYSVLGMDKYLSNVDKSSYQLLTYSSGLGHENFNETVAKLDYQNSYHKATIASTWANHGGDDVPLYATGALANILFGGSMDQSYVPHAISFAMCLGGYQRRCNPRPAFDRVNPAREKPESSIRILHNMLLNSDAPKREKQVEFDTTTTEVPLSSERAVSLSEKLSEEEEIPDELDFNATEIMEITSNSLNATEFDLTSTSDLIQDNSDESPGNQLQISFSLVYCTFVIFTIVHVL